MNRGKWRKVSVTVCKDLPARIPATKWRKPILLFALVAVLLVPAAQAKNGNWQAVLSLKPGVRILVKTQHRYPCIFVSATDYQLLCDVPHYWRLGLPSTMTFLRRDIREVRKEPNQAKDAWIGAGIGAGVGAGLAVSNNNGGYPALQGVFGGAAGAGAGALVGATVPIVQLLFHRGGKLIYQP